MRGVSNVFKLMSPPKKKNTRYTVPYRNRERYTTEDESYSTPL